MSDLDRKKAEVRKRMEEQSSAKKKKGFMTPERKKKLRVSTVLNCNIFVRTDYLVYWYKFYSYF